MSYILIIASSLLLHAGYSSYEFHHFINTTSSLKPEITTTPFPNDITLELAVSLILFLVHLFYFNSNSKKLSLVDAGREVSNDGKLKSIWMNQATVEDEIRGSSGFRSIENRVNFIDISKLRSNFQEWKSTIEEETNEAEAETEPEKKKEVVEKEETESK